MHSHTYTECMCMYTLYGNAYKVVELKTCPYSTFVLMVDADHSLEFQLNKLQLSKITSIAIDEVIGIGAFGRVIKVHMHGT